MKLQELSPKQKDFLKNSDARINIAFGSVRSGKTLVSLLRWLYIIATAPEGSNLMMVGKTERTVRRNLLDLIQELIEPEDFKLNSGFGECYIYGRKVYLVGANDERAENKVRGISLFAAYCDEITLYPESFVQMLLSRLSDPGAMLLATTNPDSPYHYIKTKFLDRADKINLKYWHFVMEDNQTLPPEYVSDLKSEYVPGTVWYKRYILGEFALAEGAIYPFFTDDPKDGYVIDKLPDDFSRYVVAADYGQQHFTVFALAGFSPSLNRWVVIKEYYTSNKPNTEYVKEFDREIINFGGKAIIPEYTDVDSGGGGLSLIQDLRAKYPTLRIRHAIKVDVGAEIQALAGSLFTHRISVYKAGCPRGISELANYVYDEKAKLRGNDEPLKRNDDFCDCMRYLWNRIAYNKLGA
jgi:PBSX family phage terminase large subunit